MKERYKRLQEELTRYKAFLDREEREVFSVVYKMVEDILFKMDRGKEPDMEELKPVRDFLFENRDTEGITDEAISAIDDYIRELVERAKKSA